MENFFFSLVLALVLGVPPSARANPPIIASPARSGDDFQFLLIGQTNAVYVIEVSSNLVTWIPVATNNEAYSTRVVTLASSADQLYYRVVRADPFLMNYALAVQDAIDLNGNNLAVDSFDSQDPNYSNNGRYEPAKAKDGGDVAVLLGLTNSLSVGNVTIKGFLRTGPDPTLALGPTGTIGSAAWVNSAQIGVEPGHHLNDMNLCFPEVQPPFATALPATAGIVGGTNYSYVLGTANYMSGSVSLSATRKALVLGNAVWWVTDGFSMSGQSQITIASNASLRLYVGRLTGSNTTTTFGGNGVINGSGNATNFFFYGLPSLTSLSQSGIAPFVGVIYAPNSDFAMNGIGSGTSDFIGASVTRTMMLNASYNFHFDENLKRLGPLPW